MRFKHALMGFLLLGVANADQQRPVEPYALDTWYVNADFDAVYEDWVPIPPDGKDGIYTWDGVNHNRDYATFGPGLYLDRTNIVLKIDPSQISFNDLGDKPSLGSAAFQSTSTFASAAQGTKADNAAVASTVTTALASKVDTVSGKALSSNDYTSAEKTKLAGIAAGATANSSDATLLSRANHTGTQAISTVTGLQTALDSKFTVPAGTTSQYVRGDGSLVTFPSIPAAQVQSDWNQSSTSSADYIKNKPVVQSTQRVRVQTDSSGNYTWTYPVAYPSGVVPVLSAISESSSSTVPQGVQIVGTPTNTSCTFKVINLPSTTVVGIVVLGAPAGAQAYIHITAIAP